MTDTPSPIPRQIGPYHVIQVIGEGGMGIVYEAEQREPVRRRVAVKMMKAGLDSREVIGRFESERQALAVMEHPGIAKVLDAGTTDQGRPYFVMELVRGIPVGEYCDRHRLSTRQRVELFIRVCEAVQHAHQKGVIHRDLKPANVLVEDLTGHANPKIIDFGVAKATGQRLTEQTVVTSYGQAIGTLAYMSPEQAEMSGLDVDTRADVYSLGVMLFELVTGMVPLDPRRVGVAAFLAQLIQREEGMPTISEALTTLDPEKLRQVAAQRRMETAELKRQLGGDLQWITMKAMEKDRARRYDTANALAFELRRFLTDEPILARAPTARYRAQKFVRRHRAGVLSAAAALVVLLVSSALVTYWAVEATRARGVAERRRTQAEDLISFMVGDLQGKLEPLGRLDILDDVGDKALEYFAALPEGELTGEELFRRSEALTQIGQVRIAQGSLPAAMEAFEEALTLAQRVVRRDPENGDWQVGLGAAYFWVGYVYWLQNDLDAAYRPMADYLAISEALVARDSTNLVWRRELGYGHSNMGSLAEARGDLHGALASYGRTVDIVEALADPDDPQSMEDLAVDYNKVAVLRQKLGDFEGARDAFLAERDIRERLVRDDSTHAHWSEFLGVNHGYVADLHLDLGDPESALGEEEAALRIAADLFARDTSNADREQGLALAERDLGLVLVELGRTDGRAQTLIESSLRRFEVLVDQDPTNTTWRRHLGASRNAAGRLYLAQDRHDEAGDLAEASISTYGPIVRDNHQNLPALRGLGSAYVLLGQARDRMGRPDQAREAWSQALETMDLDTRPTQEISNLSIRGQALLHLGRIAEARPLVDSLVALGYRERGLLTLAREKGVAAPLGEPGTAPRPGR